MLSYFFFQETDFDLRIRFVSAVFGLPGSRIWWWMIWCHLTFLIYHTFDAILGHISISDEVYWSSWSRAIISTYKVCDERMMFRYFIMIPQWSLFGAIQPYLLYIWCHTRAYFCSGWDLQILMELHAYPHLRDVRWDDDLLTILRGSPSEASLEPFDQACIVQHSDVIILLSKRHLLDLWAWFWYGRGWLGSRTWWWMIWCHSIFFDLSHIWCYIGAYSLLGQVL